MGRSIARIYDGTLQLLTDDGSITDHIQLGSVEWHIWLENSQSFRFETSSLSFTARQEQRPGGRYWYAYRRRHGKLRIAYLGKSSELSIERLNAVAAFLAEDSTDDVKQHSLHKMKGGVLQLQETPTTAFPEVCATFPHLPQHNLPAQLTSLVGREPAIATATALLRSSKVRLLNMTGTGGIGKTRLAIAVATTLLEDFHDGIYFVALAPIHASTLVLPTIAQTIHIQENGNGSIEELIKSYIGSRRLLLVLDNFEHVLDAATQVVELLTDCPGLKLLVTSREVLHVNMEQQFSIPPLALPDLKHVTQIEMLARYPAVQLFVQRAQAVKPHFQLHEANAHFIAEICMRLDGLPLAIELAAARIQLLSPQGLLSRLDSMFQILTSRRDVFPERQQTLHNLIQWSYELLNSKEQQLFRRLSVFVGVCTLEAIEAICATTDIDKEEYILEDVQSLIDKSLLQQSADEEPYLFMLETVRTFALEELTASGEIERIRMAHAVYYLQFSEKAVPELQGTQQHLWLERLEREYENIRAAMQWATESEQVHEDKQRMEIALRLGGALEWFWGRSSYAREGRDFLEQVLTGSEKIEPMIRARALNAAGMLAFLQGDLSQVEIRCIESLALFRELGDIQGTAFALMWLSEVLLSRGDLAGARSLTEEVLVHFIIIGEKGNIAWAYNKIAVVCMYQGEYKRAHTLLEESLVIARKRETAWGIIFALQLLALVLYLQQSNPASIRALLQESFVLANELNDQDNIFHYLSLSGEVALNEGDLVSARILADELLVNAREVHNNDAVMEALFILAKIEARQGNLAEAQALFEESISLVQQNGVQYIIPSYIEGLAGVIAKQGEIVRAARLWGAAEMLRETMVTPIPPVERTLYEQAVVEARVQLGRKRFVSAWNEGRAMTIGQALASQNQTPTLSSPVLIPQQSAPLRTSSLSTLGLTNREMEVLLLLSQGLTNAQIAAQLIISLHTVNAHLKVIYSKIGVTSRSAATRYAIEHRLA